MTRPLSEQEIEAYAQVLDPYSLDTLPLQEWPQQWHPTDRFPTPQSPIDDASPELVSQLSFRSAPSQYRLGEPGLPVAPYREHFVDVVSENQTSVVSSETGSGKSSNLGLYLLEAGFPKIYVTQPRIIAARELMERARYNLGEDHAHLAGYLTGNADDSDCPEDARLVYVTEHLLFKMARRGLLEPNAVVINDEAHERTAPTVVLLGIIKKLLPENPDMRLVISSATIDTDMFAKYLADKPDEPAPVLILPGRTYPTERRETTENVAETMRRYIDKGMNVLGFEPGISRLRSTASKAQGRTKEKVHLLYGDQSPAEQALALSGDHAVASRIGETSLTPQRKQVVVDSRLSNLGGFRAGVRELHTVWSSQAVIWQRGGRVGRTEPGIHVLATPDDAPPAPAFEDLPMYDPPSIESSSVASFAAELLASGIRLEDLDLLEHPTHENLTYDYSLLHRLGATALNGDGELVLTDIGRAMIDLPLDTPLARMLVEARQPTGDEEVNQEALRLQVAAAVAIQQVNGILDAAQGSQRRYVRRKGHQEVLSSEQTSDVLFALDVFTSMHVQQQKLQAAGAADWEVKFDKILTDNDILPNRYYKAVRTFEELCLREKLTAGELAKPSAEHRKWIIASQIVGAEELFVQRSKLVHLDIRGERRTLGRRTTIASHVAELVVGTAFDFRGLNKRGSYGRRFIAGGSAVTAENLLRHVPHRVTRQSIGYGVSRKDTLVDRQALYFDGELLFDEREEAMPPTVETRRKIITAMMTGMAPSARNPEQTVPFRPGTENAEAAAGVWKEALKLQEKAHVNLKVKERMASLIGKVVRESIDVVPLDVTDPALLDALIPPVYRTALVRPTHKNKVPAILRQSPDALKVLAEDEASLYLPITYKNNIAHVTIPRDAMYTTMREDFEGLEAHHPVKLRIGRGRYQHIDTAFKDLDEQREAEAAKRALKQERREAREVAELQRGGGPARWERRDHGDMENDIAGEIAAQMQRQERMLKRPKKGEPTSVRRQRVQKQIEKANATAKV